jgi:uncharacterized protein (TIGR04255 family)
MVNKDLKNKPLVEIIFEVKWGLATHQQGVAIDPHYKLLLGRFFDRISKSYPYYEQLPSATFPDEVVSQVVQHRFRLGKDDWPLIQIGPGIMTVNDTHKYTLIDFKKRSIDAINKLFESHPKIDELKIDSLMLRYIDAIDFDAASENILDFLRDKMKVDIVLPSKLFSKNIRNRPMLFNWRSSFDCQKPKGMVSIRFFTGRRDGRPAIFWETMVQTKGNDIPTMPRHFTRWVESAHKIAHDWFFILIEGELERRFSND